jgi:hypothetical protein
MIRIVALTSLAALLVLVLYLPSAYPPDRFLAQVRIEHAINHGVWGHGPALRILDRALAMQSSSRDASPIPTATAAAPAQPPVDAALAAHLSTATARLFGNPYFRSIEALATLGIYRVASLLEWLPVLVVFVAAAFFDGLICRTVKSKEFLHHNPEAFAVYGSFLVLTCCATAIAFILPVTLHPYLIASAPLVVAASGGLAVANFHARG